MRGRLWNFSTNRYTLWEHDPVRACPPRLVRDWTRKAVQGPVVPQLRRESCESCPSPGGGARTMQTHKIAGTSAGESADRTEDSSNRIGTESDQMRSGPWRKQHCSHSL
eukprot:4327494-Prymnesium_polylepis.1